MADIERVTKAVENLLEWRVQVDEELRQSRQTRERYIPILDAMIEAQKIAEAIKEHNNLARRLADAKEARAFSHGQVYLMVAALVFGSIGVPILLHFL